jgi:hypothetical protein
MDAIHPFFPWPPHAVGQVVSSFPEFLTAQLS